MSLARDLRRVRRVMADPGMLVREAIDAVSGEDEGRLKALLQAVGDEFPMTPFTRIPSETELVEMAIERAEK